MHVRPSVNLGCGGRFDGPTAVALGRIGLVMVETPTILGEEVDEDALTLILVSLGNAHLQCGDALSYGAAERVAEEHDVLEYYFGGGDKLI